MKWAGFESSKSILNCDILIAVILLIDYFSV